MCVCNWFSAEDQLPIMLSALVCFVHENRKIGKK